MSSNSRNTRRSLVAGVATTVALVALAGCSGGPAAEETSPATFMTFETPAITPEFWDESIATALESVPGFEVERIVTPDADRNAYAKQLQASGQFPDLLASISPKDFIDADLLLPFDQEWLEANFIEPDANSIDGVTYQPPSNSQVLPMVFYNKAIFEEHNVELPTTWDEFVAAVETFSAAGVTPIELAGLDPWSASMPIVALASADVLGSNPEWIQDRYDDSVSFTDDEFVSAMQKERDLIEAGAYSDSALSVDYATANTNFFEGKSAMYIMGSWLVGAFPAEQAADFGAFPLPTDDGSVVVPLNVGGTMSVSSKAADTEKSMAFAQAWTLAPESMKTLIETDGAFPLFKNIAFEDFGATVTPLYDDAYAYVAEDTVKVSAFGWVTNDDALPPGVADKFYALSQSLFSNADVEGQLAQLDADWDAAVAE